MGKYVQYLLASCLLLNLSISQALETASVTLQTVERHFYLDGIVEAIKKTTISSQTSGEIKEIFFDVDDYVEKGNMIVTLKNTEQLAKKKKAEASIQEAKALQLKASQEYERIKTLYHKKLVSKSSLDEAKAQLHTTSARLNAAQAGLSEAQEQLSYTEVLAPYSGIVIQRHVELGEIVQPGMPLMTGISLEHLRVTVNVPQSLINKLRQFSKITIMHPESGQIVAIHKITIFPFADPVTNTFQVRLDLPVGIKQLFPGMFVKVSLVTGEKQKLMVSSKAVVYRSEVTGVYVVSHDNRVSFRQIRSGGENGGETIMVLAGLDEGEQVALDPIAAGILLVQQRKNEQKGGQSE